MPAKGDYVKRGQLVGYVGMTGTTTGPHMHLGPKTKLVGSGFTNLALFEAIVPVFPPDPDQLFTLTTCYEPQPFGPPGTCYNIAAKPLISNNKKQN